MCGGALLCGEGAWTIRKSSLFLGRDWQALDIWPTEAANPLQTADPGTIIGPDESQAARAATSVAAKAGAR